MSIITIKEEVDSSDTEIDSIHIPFTFNYCFETLHSLVFFNTYFGIVGWNYWKALQDQKSFYFQNFGVMDAKSLYSEDFLNVYKVASEGLTEISTFWKEIGIQGEEESNRLEKEFLNNCCSVLSCYVEGVLQKLRMVFSQLFFNV